MRRLLLTFSYLIFAGMTCASAAGQGVRSFPTIPLDGAWNFLVDTEGKFSVSDLSAAREVRVAQVPGSWQAQFEDVRDYAGVAWYWRTVKLESLAREEAALLRFGAVDYRAEVFVNGQKAGEHESGYLPFEFDISALVRAGKGRLIVCTFSLAETYGADPYATFLLDALVKYAASDFQPVFEIPL